MVRACTYFRNCLICMALGALVAAIPSCDGGDLLNANARPIPGHAVQSPFAYSSANEEVFSRNIGAMPILTVDLPNKKNEQPTVHSMLDDIQAFTGAGATQPATRPGGGGHAQTGEQAATTQAVVPANSAEPVRRRAEPPHRPCGDDGGQSGKRHAGHNDQWRSGWAGH